MDITQFNSKLNKLDGNIYTIEEVVNPIAGVYEKELAHDNVEVNTINIYTKSKLTGTKINTYTTSTPSLTPWKTIIKIFSTEPVLYITYETTGDTVEAEDVNNLQDALNETQRALNFEIDRAVKKENQLETDLNTEINRAENKESEIVNDLNTEISRAKKAEMDEVTRAKSAEKIITDNLTKEVNRASSAEGILTDNLNAEITRAKDSENTLNTNLTNEINRAKSAENTLTTNLATEVTRAINAENSIKNTINTNKPLWDDKYTKAQIDNKISQVVSNMDWKESVATYNDIATTYPNPQDGWTVNVKDTDITYRWDGSKWISISANAIPLATSSVDGKMSKTDKSFLDTVKGLWNSVTTHISDAVKHITSAERTLWNTVSDKLDKSGGTVTGKINILGSAKDNPLNVRGINGMMDNGYGDFESSDLYLNYNTTNKVYVNGTNEVYHKGNLTNLSQLNNDAGYITQADVDMSQNHTHANKTVLDGITSDKVSSWNDGRRKVALIGSDETYDAKWYKVAEQTCKGYGNQNITFMVTSTYQNNCYGFLQLKIRSNNTEIYCPTLGWITRSGFTTEDFNVVINGMKWTLYAKHANKFGRIVFEIISSSSIDSTVDTWSLLYNHNKTYETTDPTPTVISSDISNVRSANVADRATKDSDGNQINTTYVKKSTTWNELEGI